MLGHPIYIKTLTTSPIDRKCLKDAILKDIKYKLRNYRDKYQMFYVDNCLTEKSQQYLQQLQNSGYSFIRNKNFNDLEKFINIKNKIANIHGYASYIDMKVDSYDFIIPNFCKIIGNHLSGLSDKYTAILQKEKRTLLQYEHSRMIKIKISKNFILECIKMIFLDSKIILDNTYISYGHKKYKIKLGTSSGDSIQYHTFEDYSIIKIPDTLGYGDIWDVACAFGYIHNILYEDNYDYRYDLNEQLKIKAIKYNNVNMEHYKILEKINAVKLLKLSKNSELELLAYTGNIQHNMIFYDTYLNIIKHGTPYFILMYYIIYSKIKVLKLKNVYEYISWVTS